MEVQEKIVVLEKNLRAKFSDVTDFNFCKVATEYVMRGGWHENKSLSQAIEDCSLFMAQTLAKKENTKIDIF